jgi:peptide/nickel transport system permease protein
MRIRLRKPKAEQSYDTQRGDEKYFVASHWKLMGRKFVRHRLALVAGSVLIILYLLAIFFEFFSLYDVFQRHPEYSFAQPQRLHFFHEGRFRGPFVYGYRQEVDPVTYRARYYEDKTKVYRIRFFVRGYEYKMWGMWKGDLHLMGVEEPGVFFMFGTDKLGRDVFSRIIFAARISLSIGLIGVFITFVLGCLIGGVSGYFGGAVDMLVQRIIEFLGGIPTLPLWMLLSASVPHTWSPIYTYFGITVILSIIGWTGMARTVRNKLMQFRFEDHVLAARIAGAKELRIIVRHMLPGITSLLIVRITLGIPGMILGETALSFIGIGLRAPVVSWGVMLQQAQNARTVVIYPWLMIPAVFVIITVLCFNFVGDGLRDAADPYKV